MLAQYATWAVVHARSNRKYAHYAFSQRWRNHCNEKPQTRSSTSATQSQRTSRAGPGGYHQARDDLSRELLDGAALSAVERILGDPNSSCPVAQHEQEFLAAPLLLDESHGLTEKQTARLWRVLRYLGLEDLGSHVSEAPSEGLHPHTSGDPIGTPAGLP